MKLFQQVDSISHIIFQLCPAHKHSSYIVIYLQHTYSIIIPLKTTVCNDCLSQYCWETVPNGSITNITNFFVHNLSKWQEHIDDGNCAQNDLYRYSSLKNVVQIWGCLLVKILYISTAVWNLHRSTKVSLNMVLIDCIKC